MTAQTNGWWYCSRKEEPGSHRSHEISEYCTLAASQTSLDADDRSLFVQRHWSGRNPRASEPASDHPRTQHDADAAPLLVLGGKLSSFLSLPIRVFETCIMIISSSLQMRQDEQGDAERDWTVIFTLDALRTYTCRPGPGPTGPGSCQGTG